jgi:hypothetical protein
MAGAGRPAGGGAHRSPMTVSALGHGGADTPVAAGAGDDG